jgi:hypothetical protein
MDELLLSIAPRPFPPHLDLKGFYVMVSRARTRRRLRVLHRPPRRKGALDHLFKLKHTAELGAWDKGYNASGEWNPARAQPNVAPKAHAKAPKRRKVASSAGA